MRFLCIIASFFVASLLPAQQKGCGFNTACDALFKKYPEKESVFKKIIAEQEKTRAAKSSAAAATYTIPMVFHVLHLGGDENISDAQIIDAVAILNRDFRKLNADTMDLVAQYQGLAADTKIEFRLATKDPNGNCTNGITRHYDPHTNWIQSGFTYSYTWPPTQYLNIYVVRSCDGGAAAYTYLPGMVPAAWDAVVAVNNYVGSIGTSGVFTSRVLSHEVGHWLGLQHTWGSTNSPGVACGDDAVNDTPITKGHSNCNLNNASVCSATITENIQNYMEYAYCQRMFTQGQADKMQNTLITGTGGRDNLYTNQNLIATGVINPLSNCAPKAEFRSTGSITCVGSTLTFNDESYNAPVTAWEWSSNLASSRSFNQIGTLSFSATGQAAVQLKVSNNNGSDSILKTYVTVLSGPTAAGAINSSQGFENTFPGNNWVRTVPQFGTPFVQTTLTAASGSNCAGIDNFFDSPNAPVAIFSPVYNFQFTTLALLNFKYAYAQLGAANMDKFSVYASTDCGSNWTTVYQRQGPALNTAGGAKTAPFTPTTITEWKIQAADVGSFAGSGAVVFKFEFAPDVNGPGNNFYLDDINLITLVGLEEMKADQYNLRVYPDPFSNEFTISFDKESKIKKLELFDVSGRKWKELEFYASEEKIKFSGLNEFARGIYFLKLSGENGTYFKKIVKE
jgi:hypothetical protein